MRPIPRVSRWTVMLLAGLVIVSTALLNAVAFADHGTSIAISHQVETGTPPPDCEIPTPIVGDTGTPADHAAGDDGDVAPPDSTPSSAVASGPAPELDLRIQATAGNNLSAERGLPYPLRLFTVRLPAAGVRAGEIGAAECRLGYLLLSIEAGEVEFTHHAAPNGETDLGSAGAVTFVRGGETVEQPLAVSASDVMRPGDVIFFEEAIFSFRSVGSGEALLLGSAVTPEWLPCTGGGCN